MLVALAASRVQGRALQGAWRRAEMAKLDAQRKESAALAAEAARVANVPLTRRHVYAGSFQWFHWDEVAFVPRGWGMGPWNARRQAARMAQIIASPSVMRI